jgi:hypothetical protein
MPLRAACDRNSRTWKDHAILVAAITSAEFSSAEFVNV